LFPLTTRLAQQQAASGAASGQIRNPIGGDDGLDFRGAWLLVQ
jgi:hypothetical protein